MVHKDVEMLIIHHSSSLVLSPPPQSYLCTVPLGKRQRFPSSLAAYPLRSITDRDCHMITFFFRQVPSTGIYISRIPQPSLILLMHPKLPYPLNRRQANDTQLCNQISQSLVSCFSQPSAVGSRYIIIHFPGCSDEGYAPSPFCDARQDANPSLVCWQVRC